MIDVGSLTTTILGPMLCHLIQGGRLQTVANRKAPEALSAAVSNSTVGEAAASVWMHNVGRHTGLPVTHSHM